MERIKIILLFLGVLLGMNINGQTPFYRAEISSQFEGDSTWWITEYNGRWADFHEISIILGYNGTDYHGKVKYLSSGLEFHLHGQDEGDYAHLFELDEEGRHCGVFELKITDNRINGVWWNSDLSYQSSVTALKSSSIPIQKFEPHCNQYRGELNENESFLIHKEAPNQVNGHMKLENQPFILSFSGTCLNTTCTKWTANIFDETGLIGSLNGHEKSNKIAEVDLIDLDNSMEHFTFNNQNTVKLNIRSYINYSGSIDISTINIQSEVFQSFIDRSTDDWWQNGLAILKAHEDISTQSTLDRQKYSWNAWIEIGYLEDKLLTGMIVLSGKDNGKNIPFAFDREKEEFLEEQDIFQKGNTAKSEIDKWTKIKRQNLLTEQVETYDSWIKSASFEQAYFRTDGWIITSEFSPIYGTAEIVISIDEMQEVLRKKSLINSMYK